MSSLQLACLVRFLTVCTSAVTDIKTSDIRSDDEDDGAEDAADDGKIKDE